MLKVGWRYSWRFTGVEVGVSVEGVVLTLGIKGHMPALLANSMPLDDAEVNCATER
jgi:hypothetical protein